MNEQDKSPLLDKEQLQMLVDAGGSDSYDLYAEILELYIEESALKIQEIENHRNAGNFDLMGKAAHALAGSSANIGGLRVWQLAKEIENRCKEGNGAAAAQDVQELVSTHEKTVAALRDFGPPGQEA